ncbi:hypothetical protein U1Q18_045349, partial [Sarracenia purpurea var. burkii]
TPQGGLSYKNRITQQHAMPRLSSRKLNDKRRRRRIGKLYPISFSNTIVVKKKDEKWR